MSCNDAAQKVAACTAGSQDAQRAAALANSAGSLLLLLCNPVVGRYSDTAGRRPVLLLALFLQCLPAAVFWYLQRQPHWHPTVYYTVHAIATGSVSYVSLVFAALSDNLQQHHRAPAYGLLMAGLLGGFALAPSLAWIFPDPNSLGTLSLILIGMAWGVAVIAFPETLAIRVEPVAVDDTRRGSVSSSDPAETTSEQTTEVTSDCADLTAATNIAAEPGTMRSNHVTADGETDASFNDDQALLIRGCPWLLHTVTQPLRNVSILNRNVSLRWLTAASFLSSMVFASDATLFVYYIQQKLHVHASDLATLGLCLGIAGMVVQGGLLQPLTAALGEKRWLIMSFVCGAGHNYLYGVARSMPTLYVALVLSQFTKTNIPLLSSQVSRAVHAHEQGQALSALFATNALASAVGPVSMEWVQQRRPHGSGTGFMFQYAAGLYLLGAILLSRLPKVEHHEDALDENAANRNGDYEESRVALSLRGEDEDDNQRENDPLLLVLHPNDTSNGNIEEPLLVQKATVEEQGRH